MSRCGWISRDDKGRPACVHGPAIKAGPYWRCRHKAQVNGKKWRRTPAGIESRKRENRTEHSKSTKALYNLTRTRIRF